MTQSNCWFENCTCGVGVSMYINVVLGVFCLFFCRRVVGRVGFGLHMKNLITPSVDQVRYKVDYLTLYNYFVLMKWNQACEHVTHFTNHME